MTPEQFVYWLQGYTELSDDVPNLTQWKIIKNHLELVFDKQTPVVPLEKPLTYIQIPVTSGNTYPDYLKPQVTCSVTADGPSLLTC